MVMYLEEAEISNINRVRRSFQTNELTTAKDASEVAELTAANRLLVAGLFQALELRGIFSAICDPLILQGEKLVLIERYKQIEANIRLAIEKSDR